MIDRANTACQILAHEAKESYIELIYDDYIDDFMAGYQQLQYSVQSYDDDASFYGEKQ
jgi:hypothetical protein